MSFSSRTPFRDHTDAFQAGRLNRRQFMARSTALGMPTTIAIFMANASPVIAGACHCIMRRTPPHPQQVRRASPMPGWRVMLVVRGRVTHNAVASTHQR